MRPARTSLFRHGVDGFVPGLMRNRGCPVFREQIRSHPTNLPRRSEVPGRFVDITEKAGVHFLHQAPHTSRKYLIETMGSGVALFDCDNDGRLDLYLVNGAPYSDPTPKGFIPQKDRSRVLESHVPPEGRWHL